MRIPGTNRQIELTVGGEGTTLPSADDIIVSIRAIGVALDKTGSDLHITDNKILVDITQAESLLLQGSTKGKIQVNWLDGTLREATIPTWFDIGEQLYLEVMS